MKIKKAEPQRTCLSCRKKQVKKNLIRITCFNGKIRLDKEQNLPGRGVYLCPNDSCLASLGAKKRLKLWQGAFRYPASRAELLSIKREIETLLEKKRRDEEGKSPSIG